MSHRSHKPRNCRANSESSAPAEQTRPLEGEIGRPAGDRRDTGRRDGSGIDSLDASNSNPRRTKRSRPKVEGPKPALAATPVNTGGHLDKILTARAAALGARPILAERMIVYDLQKGHMGGDQPSPEVMQRQMDTADRDRAESERLRVGMPRERAGGGYA